MIKSQVPMTNQCPSASMTDARNGLARTAFGHWVLLGDCGLVIDYSGERA
jgi:hypothetical protein